MWNNRCSPAAIDLAMGLLIVAGALFCEFLGSCWPGIFSL